MNQERSGGPEPAEQPERVWEVVEGFLTAAFKAAGQEIKTPFPRYSLTALGEAVVLERRRGPRFRGFGPCAGMVCA